MGAVRRGIFYGRLKRVRHALSEAGWSWVERGAILVGLAWLLLRARGDLTPFGRRTASGDFRPTRGSHRFPTGSRREQMADSDDPGADGPGRII